MYAAKRSGAGGAHLFVPEMHQTPVGEHICSRELAGVVATLE